MVQSSSQSQPLLDAIRRVAESVVPPSDDQLWERVRTDHRDLAALTELYRRWRSPLVLLARRDGVAPDRAEELVNGAFASLLRVGSREKYRPVTRAFAYLRTCVDRACWRACRAERRRAVLALSATAEAQPEPDPVAREELAAAVREALASLSDRQRLAAELHYLFGWTEPRVAEAIGVKPSTVKEHLDRARQKLREALAKWNPAAVAGGGLAVGAVLADAAKSDALPPERLAVAVQSILAQAAVPAAWGKALAVLAALLAIGGAAAATVAGGPEEAPPPAGPPRVVAASEENDPIPPELLAGIRDAMRGVPFGGGEAAIENAEEYDTRTDVTVGLHHRIGHKPGWVSRVRFVHDADAGQTLVYLDYTGGGRFDPIRLHEPIILYRDSLLGLKVTLPFAPLERVCGLFAALPKNGRAAAEAADYRERLRAAFGPYLGKWYRQGDAGRVCNVSFGDEGPVLRDDQGYEAVGFAAFRLTADRRPQGLVYHGSRVDFAPDGGRIDLPAAGDWWTREPNIGGR